MKTTILSIITFLFINFSYGQNGKSRSAKTGRYVTGSYAKSHPSTTYTSKKK